jgi:membrane protein
MLAKIGMESLKAKGRFVWSLLLEVYQHFMARDCQQSAAALTYVSLFSLVPMLTLVYSLVSILPASSELEALLQRLIFENLVPASGQAVQEHLSSFTERARSLTLPGVVLLVVTAYLMLKTIEKAFNKIWGVEQARSGLSNFLIYQSILTLGPILIGAGLAISTYLLSIELMWGGLNELGLTRIFLTYLPGLLAAIAFTLFFALVPNCSVPLRDAAIGGLVTAILFESGKNLFTALVAKSSYELIYGAFAIVPLFLLWIYVLWVLILGGAVLVRSLVHLRIEDQAKGYTELMAAMVVISQVVKAMRGGAAVRAANVYRWGVHPEQFNRIKNRLLTARILAETRSGRFVLGRTLDSVTVRDVEQCVAKSDFGQVTPIRTQLEPWQETLQERIDQCCADQSTALDLSLLELFEKPG